MLKPTPAVQTCQSMKIFDKRLPLLAIFNPLRASKSQRSVLPGSTFNIGPQVIYDEN
ncbi:hypothetical protein [Novosphingobium sp. YAF33]|uniref:hypothetical protein n=1 Tax=Novosphingobium sp. YAF33 TaxID=3233082 RepID=UPI003F97C9C4